MAKRKHLINVHTSTGTTAPTGASLYLGEIAVQHKATDPALWIKVGAAESSTQYEKFVGEGAVSSAISQAVSSSITGVSMNGSEVGVTNKVATLGTVITAETQLSTATTGTGNVVGSIGVSNHKITTTMFSAASADQISKLSGATTAHTANTTMHVTSTERTRWNNAWTSGVSAYTKVESLSAATTGISDNLDKLSAGTIALVASSAATVFSSAKTYTDNEIGKLDSTGHTSDASHYLTSVTITNGKITAVGEEAVPSESSITTATSGGGNVISNITATGHQLTLVKNVTAATSAQVSTLSAATHSHVTNGDIHVTAAQKTNWTNSGTSGANAYVGYIAHSANTGIHVTTADKNTWNGKQDAISDLATIRNNALSGASAYTRVNDLSAVTLTGVSVVGTALPVSNHAVNVPSASSSVFGVVKAGSFLTSSNGTLSVSTGTGSNNVARGDHSHSNYATTTNLDALSAATTAHTADTTAHVTSEDKTLWNAAITGVTSAGTGNAFTDYSVSGNKLTLTKGATYLTTAATTTQGTRADNALQIVSGSTYIEMSAKSGSAGAKMQTATVKQQGVETASATGQGLADAYDVKQYVESLVTSSVDYKGATATLPTTSTVGDMYITTAQIALTAAQSATGAAQTAETGDFIIARSAGKWDVIQKNLDGAVTGSLTADTVTLGSGTHTVKSLANGSNGQVLAVVSNKPAWTSAVKVNSATTADSATNATNAVSATTSQSANTAAALTGNITTGQVTDLTTKIQTTKVNSATTADSATNASKVNNHTVESNVPSDAVFTDTATTQTGHYTPSASASTEGSTTGFIRQIKLDSKKHVVGIVSGTTSFTETAVTTKAGTTGSTAAPVLSSITTGGTKGHELTLNYTNKVNSATTADSATNASKVNNHTVNSDVPASALFTDSATTETGHYSPTTSASTKGTTAATTNFVKGIRIDSKNHVIDVVTGTVVTAQTQLSTATTGTGNVVCGLTVSNHKITTLMFSAAPADALVALSAATTAHTANTTMHITADERTRWNNAWTSGVSAYTKVEELSAGTLYELKQTNHNIPYVVTNETGTTARLTASSSTLSSLTEGQSIILHLKSGTTTATTEGFSGCCTLNITLADGTETGQKKIYYGGTTLLTTHYGGGNDIRLTYHENLRIGGTTGLTGWWVEGNYYGDTDRNVGNIYERRYAGNRLTRYQIIGVGEDERLYPLTRVDSGDYNTGTTKPVNTVGFRPERFFYRNTTAATAANAVEAAQVDYQSIYFTYPRYTFNSDLTTYKAIYLRGTYDESENLFYLNTGLTTFYTQVPTNTANITLSDYFVEGDYYIYLGATYSSTNYFQLDANHELFYFDGTNLVKAWSSKILGSEYTYSGIPYVNSATSIAAAYSALTNELLVDEEAVAASLNDLNARIASIPDCSADLQELSGVVEANELVTAHALNDLNSRIIELSGSTGGGDASSIMLTGYHISCGSTEAELTLAETDSVNNAFGKIQKQILDNEEAIAASLNDLNARVSSMSSVGSDLNALSGAVKVKEFVIAQALNDLNDKVYELSGATVSILPPFTAADAGKVLSIDNNGQLVWISLT